MELFQIAILILFGLALSDLIVGVSNDAVNFLNSSIGSRVAPRNVIMIIARLAATRCLAKTSINGRPLASWYSPVRKSVPAAEGFQTPCQLLTRRKTP